MTEYITSRKNPLLIHLKKLLNSRSYRYEQRQFAGDGTKLLAEAIRWGAELDTVITTMDELPFSVPLGVRIVRVPSDVMQSVSLMEAPQGCMFICRMPQEKPLQIPQNCLILDGLQDPGNVGTILRTADAFEIPVILNENCADVYNPKTVRASMGAVFRSQALVAKSDEIISAATCAGVTLYATALSDASVSVLEHPVQGAVVIGSEGSGVSSAFLQTAEKHLIIPMNPNCESLNAASAATVILWEMKRNL
jgi:TrmH family RNA methyltransferase